DAVITSCPQLRELIPIGLPVFLGPVVSLLGAQQVGMASGTQDDVVTGCGFAGVHGMIARAHCCCPASAIFCAHARPAASPTATLTRTSSASVSYRSTARSRMAARTAATSVCCLPRN